MTESQTPNKLTRRQALKTLAAIVGAGTLNALPIQWGKPGLRTGALPVFAQVTGGVPRSLAVVSAPPSDEPICNEGSEEFTVSVVPPVAGIEIRFRAFSNGVEDADETDFTDAAGEVTFSWGITFDDPYEFEFTFVNPADGTGSIGLIYDGCGV